MFQDHKANLIHSALRHAALRGDAFFKQLLRFPDMSAKRLHAPFTMAQGPYPLISHDRTGCLHETLLPKQARRLRFPTSNAKLAREAKQRLQALKKAGDNLDENDCL